MRTYLNYYSLEEAEEMAENFYSNSLNLYDIYISTYYSLFMVVLGTDLIPIEIWQGYFGIVVCVCG